MINFVLTTLFDYGWQNVQKFEFSGLISKLAVVVIPFHAVKIWMQHLQARFL